MALTKIDVNSLIFNPFDAINKQWLLVSAGTPERFNTMTASWGAVGVIWGAPSATCYVRHSRYTHEFMDQNDCFTLTVLQDGHRDALNLLGSKSGRDIDKMHESGLTPVFIENQPTFEEAALVFICKKRFVGEIPESGFQTPETLEKWYPDRDMHTMYIGEIIACYQGK